jgi:hypothetical protein
MASVADIAAWRTHRKQFDPNGLNGDVGHQALHILKAAGSLAALGEHRQHGEPDSHVEPKRVADLIIHTIWFADLLGFDVDRLVAQRIVEFDDGFQGICSDCGHLWKPEDYPTVGVEQLEAT